MARDNDEHGPGKVGLRQRLARPPLRQIVQVLAVLAISYAVIIVVLLLQENRFVYHPYREGDAWYPPPADLKTEDAWMTLADGTRIHGWWCPLEGAEGAVLFAHGNGGNVSFYGRDALRLQQALGRSILLFDYPGYGKSEGTPSEAGCYAAADAAHAWLTARVPAERLVVFGDSLGGGVATDLAARRPHRALVLCKTFSSLADMAQKAFPYLPGRYLVRNRFESIDKITRCRRPIFIAHGDRDSLIPYAQGRLLFEAAPEPKRFFTLAGCDHETPTPAEFYTELAEFLDSME